MMFPLSIRTSLVYFCASKTFQRFTQSASVNHQEDSSQQPLKSWRDIPGPPSLPIIGQLHHFLPGVGTLGKLSVLELFDHFYKNYGPIVKMEGYFGMPDLVLLFDPEAMAQVLRAENLHPARPAFPTLEYYRKYHKKTKEQSDLPTGLLTDDGEKWKRFRSKVNPVLMKPKTIKLYKSSLDEVARDMVERLKTLRDDSNMIKENFDLEMNKWALESIGVVALGGRIGCLDSDSPQTKALIQCVHDIFHVADELDFKPSLWRYYETKTFKRAMNLYEQQMELGKFFIKRAVKGLQESNLRTDDEKSVLEKLLEIDEDAAFIMASDMLFAGVDTAANTVMAILYFLGTHTDKQDRVRKEIQSGDDSRPYLRACMREAMRMMPVVPGNLRKLTKECNLLGYSIPKNAHISFAHQYVSMMESQYLKSKDFIPERWLAAKDEPLYHGNAHPFASQPFGFGVRMCIGKRIAELELEIFTSRIIENFMVEWVGPPPKVQNSSINYVRGPYNYVFKDV